MAKTDLKVTIDAEAAKLEREIQRTQRSMDRLARDIQRTELQAAKLDAQLEQQTARALERVGRGMLVFGAATLAGLGLATKAAMDWESAWAGVLKTVEGSPEQLAEVEAGLRDLATTLPATHTEIAAVAEAAGQLGIATPDIVGFTRVMIDLGETTNLSATEAATALARFMNIMGTASDDVDRLGSTIVDLGNNAETTEAEIVEMATRIAGAGATVGLAETDVLALATAMSSVGIRAEAGGTAISRVMSDIASAVASGGDAVTDFAEVAGMSASEFAAAFERDPARAIQSFIEGLGRINDAGGNVFGTLDNLGLGGIRVRDVLLRLSSAGDILNENLDRSAQAWQDNSALVEEAERRYDTAEAKIQIAKNALVDLGIDIGSVLLPALSTLAEGAADLFGWFSDLPGPIKTVFTILSTLAGAASLAGAAFLLLAPKIAAARAEMQLLQAAHPGAHGALRALGRTAGIVGGLLAVAGAIAAIAQATKEAPPAIGETTKALVDLGRGVETDLIVQLVAAHTAMREAEAGAGVVARGFSSSAQQMSNASSEFERIAGSIDTALEQLVSGGNADEAQRIVGNLAEALGLTGGEMQELIDRHLPRYTDALDAADAQQKLTAESADQVDQQLVDLADQFGLTGDDAAKAAQEMLDAWAEASTEFIDILGAYNEVLAAKEEKERETAQETADATEDASDSWEDYVKDVKVSIDEYLKELERQVKAQQNWQKNMLTLAGRVSAGTLDELAKLGPEGAPLVAELVDASDEELARFEELMGARAEAGGQNFAQRLAEAEPVLKQIARDEGQEVANSIAAGMAANGSTVFEEAKRQGVNVDRGVGTNRTRQVPINVPLPTGLRRVDGVLNNLARPRFATVHVGYAVSGGLPVGLQRGHSGGVPRFHSGGIIPRFHNGGGFGLGHDEGLAILQSRERVLSREQNRAFEDFVSSFTPSVPVLPRARGGDGASVLHIQGSGPGFDWIINGVRTGQLRLSVNGAAVRAG